MKINTKFVMILTLLIIIGLINFIPDLGSSKEITHFKNDLPGSPLEITINLKGETGYNSDSSAYFAIPIHKGEVQEASLKVSCSSNESGAALLNPRIDIGFDGDYEWEFTGKGYGAVGHQTIFTSDMERRIIALGNIKMNNKTRVYLPEGAVVSSASMNIIGGNLKYGEVYIAAITRNGDIYYIKSNGDKTFQIPSSVGSLGNSWVSYGIGIGDFDSDGDNDIIANTGSGITGEIYEFKKTGSGNSFSKISTPVGTTGASSNTDFAVGDFNNDNKLDFVESERNQNFYFFEGNGDNTFDKTKFATSFSGGTAYGKDSADFNLDGNLDFVSGGTTSGSVYYFEGNGDGSFDKAQSVKSGTSWGTECALAGDFDNDGNPDIIAKDGWWTSSNFYFIKGNGDGTFREPLDTGISVSCNDPTGDGFDFNFDGYQDFVSYDSQGHIYCFWGTSTGTFTTYTEITQTPISSLSCIATPPSALLGGCNNLTVDVGEHGGEPDWEFQDAITSTEIFPPQTHPSKFADRLNTILSNPPSKLRRITDEYGNKLIEIPIRFTADNIGNLMLKNLSIRYEYETTIDINPHNGNLVNELNDLIPKSGSGEYRVYFSVAASSPGEITFSDLVIKFNEAPTTTTIPDREINEGTDNLKLYELIQYFNDEELPQDLTYSIQSYTNTNYVDVSIYDNYYLHVDASGSPDWYGESNIVVTAMDSEEGITRSNEFKVIIRSVNDPPRVRVMIDNINILTDSLSDEIDLDDPVKSYFYDVDDANMYFRAAVYDEEASGNFDGYLRFNIDNDTNILQIQSYERNKRRIPVRIYCSDDDSILTMPISQLINIPTYQQILVNITSFGIDEEELFPPVWQEIEDIIIYEDESKLNWLNLNNYTYDADDTTESLIFSVDSVENSAYMDVSITTSKDRTENILSIVPAADFDGEAVATLKVEDDDHNVVFEQFKITLIPVPDIPTVAIMSPINNSVVSGVVSISGTAHDPENGLERVEVKIGNEPWVTVTGTLSYWKYNWDSTNFGATSGTINIKARAMDVDNSYSIFDSIFLQINNVIADEDGDEVPDIYDACPTDPMNWQDSDGDGVGDNTDKFPNNPTQWQDSDGDGYGENPSGTDYDMFPFDPTQWADSDGDGFGDNLEGNRPDYYPNDSTRSGNKKDTSTDSSLDQYLVWLAIIPFVILDTLIFMYYLSKRKKTIKK